MSKCPGPDVNGALQARIEELERQLAVASREEQAQDDVEAGLRKSLEYLENIVSTVREPMLVLDWGLRVRTASRAFYHTFGVSKTKRKGGSMRISEMDNGISPPSGHSSKTVLEGEESFQDFEVIHDFPVLGRRVMLLNARKLWPEGNRPALVLLAIEDITERKRMEEELVRSNEDMQRFAYVAAHDLRSPLNSALKLCKLVDAVLKGR